MIRSASLCSTSISTLVIACAMAAFTLQPAASQTAKKLKCNGCVNSKDIKNSGIKSKDIKDGQVIGADLNPAISIGTGGNDGDLSVKNAAGMATVSLDGDTGNVTNQFSNTSAASNGLVKAWAKLNGNGMIAACWRCNASPAETRRLEIGSYEIDFSPLGTDIRGRPRAAALDDRGFAATEAAVIKLQDQSGVDGGAIDFSSVVVQTFNLDGNAVDTFITVLIY